ncbi:MAG: aminotransferase class V-fold PLP-dependent enzyme [Bacteroidota bacterium]
MLAHQKEAFSIPEEVTYLNHAYMSPCLKAAEEVGIASIQKLRHPFLMGVDDFFQPARDVHQIFSRLINNPDPERVVLVPSVSYGMANVAQNLSFHPGDKILVSGRQFPSNVYPWQKIAQEQEVLLQAIAPPALLSERGRIWNERMLEAIDDRTKMVALPHIHWEDGTRFDLENIRQKCDEVGALLIIDATQSLGALPFDLQKIRPDALVCGGYKWLLGPYSLGLAYYGEKFDAGKPIEESWMNRSGSDSFRDLSDYENKYLGKAGRYEVGEHSNFILLPMLKQALLQLEEWQVGRIQEYAQNISQYFIEELKDLGGWTEDETYRAAHLFGIRMPEGLAASELFQHLRQNNIYTSQRGDAIRLSLHVYNQEADLNKLLGLLKASYA